MPTTAQEALQQANKLASDLADESSKPVSNVERRFVESGVDIRNATGKRTISGYAAKFNRTSHFMGFYEQIAPGAFSASQAAGWPNVVAKYNHDNQYLLGTIRSGTLRLTVDRTGLLYDVDVPRSREDVFELVERGDVSQSSFAFIAYEDEWDSNRDGTMRRTVLDLRLLDVSPVFLPAYEDTSAAARSLARHFDISDVEAEHLLNSGESSRLIGPAKTILTSRRAPADTYVRLAKAISLT